MKKINVLFILFILLSLSNCLGKGNYTKKGQRESWNKFIQSTSSDNWILVELGEWQYNCYKSGCIRERKIELYNYETNILSSSWLNIHPTKKKSYECKKESLVYVGKWQYVEKLDADIRLFACQKKVEGIYISFETKDEKSEKISPQPLKLNRPAKGGMSLEKERVALVRWFDKYGYNAYFDLKTGEIKQAKE